ncbi:hypothetical protein [Desulfotomaculum copahuensis]|uniref:Uncharacterized protein n=1 Tax=Desulfotomaculum copahuensis TaxID=1838280 RepID=A0A1B7LC32_9FIRM|nr:hypothetical protein [Desulfotomaculum copahuensis]OAT80297.1 hypothetical protein A6M21_13845 [Desulfotomaculum copahuensis]
MPITKNLWAAVCLACLLTLAGWLAAPYARAQTGSVRPDMLVPAGERVENVLLFGRSGVIAGEVTDEVVVINGNLTLAPTARISDRVIVIGGRLNRETGAQVGKGILDIDAGQTGINTLFAALLGTGLLTMGKFMAGVTAILIFIFAAALLPDLSRRATGIMQEKTLQTLLLGLLGALAVLSLSAALILSRWGIPLALLIMLAGGVLLLPGLTGLALLCGDILNRGTGHRMRSPALLAALGSLPLVALLVFPLVGVILTLLVVLLTFGAGLQLIRRPAAGREDED